MYTEKEKLTRLCPDMTQRGALTEFNLNFYKAQTECLLRLRRIKNSRVNKINCLVVLEPVS